jgi:hypothetical protein
VPHAVASDAEHPRMTSSVAARRAPAPNGRAAGPWRAFVTRDADAPSASAADARRPPNTPFGGAATGGESVA